MRAAVRIQLSVIALLAIALTSAQVGLPASPPLSISQYRAAAGAICKTEEDQLNYHIPKGLSLAHGLEFVEKTQESTYSSLARLKAPPALAELDAEMLKDLRTLLQGYPPLVTAAKHGMAAYERALAPQSARDNRLGKDVGALMTKMRIAPCDG